MKMKKLLLIHIALFLLSLNGYSQKDTTIVKKVFVPSGKIWGYVFGDVIDKMHTNTFIMNNTQYAATPKDYTSFDFRRIYLGYDYEISEKFSSQFLLASEGQTTSDGSRTVFVKAANLKWKNIVRNIDIMIGQMQTTTFSTGSDPTWGYRSLEKTIIDMRKIGNSYDMGVSLQGRFNDKGNFGYSLMVGNGTAAKPETDKFKKKYVDIWAKLMDQKIVVDFGADNEIAQTTPYRKSKSTVKAFVGYQTPRFTIGLEGFTQLQKNSTIFPEKTPSLLKDTVNGIASGVSVFAKGVFNNKLGWVLRYDHYNPDGRFNVKNDYAVSYPSFFTESFVLAGLDYTAAKNVHIMPNIWFNRYDNRDASINKMSGNSYDLVARVTVYYIFK
jgi:hypothetical protein